MRLGLPLTMTALGLAMAPATAQTPPSLAGDWIVDLTPKPGDTPYLRPMKLVLAADGGVSGLFYQSEIDAGHWKTLRNRTCVSFRTHDDRGPYHTAACLVGDHVEGQTWAEARNFLFNWNAVRGETGK